MKIWLSIFLFCFCHSILFAQWHDEFSDGDFEDHPAWQGDVDKFIVDGNWLRLNAQTAGTSCLSVASGVVSDATWEFVFKMDFNPSSSNYAKVYLITDKDDLTEPLNGYFLRLGSADDDICLFRQNGNTVEKLISGRPKVLDKNNSHVRVLVTHDTQGYWTLKVDPSGGRNFALEGGAQDNHIKTSFYFGIVCTYIATRGTGFYFSDFHVDGQPYTDTEKPAISSHHVDGQQIRICFSEAISSILPSGGQIVSIDGTTYSGKITKSENSFALDFLLPDDVQCGIRHKLYISGFSDLQGNTMRDTTLNFSLLCPVFPNDIVINEIMANPYPAVRLPEYEYVELYNRSGKNIELAGWTFTYGNTVKAFPPYLLPAGGYLLLAHPDAEPDLAGYGATLPVLGSQTAVSNAGQYLMLMDRSGNCISWVDFTADWYADPLKAGSGWSLEQIDPNQSCSGIFNWKASIDRNGGTPGKQNSVAATNPDNRIPEIWRIATPNVHTIILYASKPFGNTVPGISQISVNPEIPVKDIRIAGTHFDQIQLLLQSPLQDGQWYDLSVTGNVYDCAGYETGSAGFHFSLPSDADSLDVVVNEILFRPSAEGYTFIELYNRSPETIDAGDLRISLRDANGKLSAPAALTDNPFLLMPGQYLVVSRNTESVIKQFGAANRAAFLQMPDMPSLHKESGRLVLLNKNLHIVDEIYYSSEQHSDFLKISDAVSLERLHPDRSSLDAENWHTAAQTAGFGTPGEKNSQHIELTATKSEIQLEPEVFSPDNDGFDDLLQIKYRFDAPSLMAEVIVFDSAGRKIRQLVSRQLIATEGVIVWDGGDDKGRKALTGIYIVYVHVYNSNGMDKLYKAPCVLAGKGN